MSTPLRKVAGLVLAKPHVGHEEIGDKGRTASQGAGGRGEVEQDRGRTANAEGAIGKARGGADRA